MRLRIISLFIVIGALVIAGYFYWQQPASAPNVFAPTNIPSTPPPALPQSDIQNTPTPYLSQSGKFVNGIAIDNTAASIAEVDILHRIVSIKKEAECYALDGSDFELSESTELITSDERGLFSLPLYQQAPDEYHQHCLIVSASKQGYLTTTVSLPLDIQDLPNIVEVELSPNAAVNGVVFNPSNQTLSGATVVAWQSNNAGENADAGCALESGKHETSHTTNDKGEFTLNLIADESYCLQAYHSDWSHSTPRWINSGDVNTTLYLQLFNRHQLSGQVVDVQGAKIPRFALSLNSDKAGALAENYQATTDSNGDFTFSQIDSGHYTLSASDPAYQVANPNEVIVDTQQKSEAVVVTVFPVSIIRGRMLDSNGESLASVEVSARSPYSIEGTISRATTDNRGYFELKSLHQSDTAQQNFNMAMTFVESSIGSRAFSGDVCVDFFHPQHRSQTVALATRETSLDLGEIQMQYANQAVSGQVLNHRDEPIVATLTFTSHVAQESKPLETRLPTCDDVQLERNVTTDESGRFTVNLDDTGLHTVKVETNNYQARQFTFDISGAGDSLEIQLD